MRSGSLGVFLCLYSFDQSSTLILHQTRNTHLLLYSLRLSILAVDGSYKGYSDNSLDFHRYASMKIHPLNHSLCPLKLSLVQI